MDKRLAYRRIRAHIGREVCPLIHNAIRRADALESSVSRDTLRAAIQSVRSLHEVSATTHGLRQALMGLLVLHTENPVRCPNCQRELPRHNDKCVLGRLIKIGEESDG
jgi:hypothetical protein